MSLNLEKLNVLIIDDNQHMRVLVKTILRALGVTNLRESTDGSDAFEELKLFSADVIICDLAMAPLDGLEFTKLMRTAGDSPNKYVPIIMMSGHTEMRNVIEARNAGVTEFLAKPISTKLLYSRIAAVIEQPRQFVKLKSYFGPDRRRKAAKVKGNERRGDQIGADRGLNQDEINSLMCSA